MVRKALLVIHNPAGYSDTRLIDIVRSPSPTIMAAGIGGDCLSHYWIEGEREPMVHDASKPPYRVPSMPDIESVRGTNGFSIVSTFSGCGGSCLGFEMAGYRVLWASEFIDAARIVYKANHPGVTVDDRDIRTVTPDEILTAVGMQPGELDVLEGSPPCASFSMSGKRSKSWGEVKKYSDKSQRTDDLFSEYARILRGLQPKVFVAENVSGLVRGAAKGYFKQILAELQGCGYVVQAKLLDAQWLGVPQVRQRIIFIGVRNDLCEAFGVKPSFPSPLPYRYSITDACPWMPGPRNGVDEIGFSEANDDSRHCTDDTAGGLSGYCLDAESAKLMPGQGSDKYINLVKPHPDKPCPTVTQTGGNPAAASVIHPTEKRKFTIGELKRICAFPDDFELSGSYIKQWERLGRSVPPLMMKSIADVIRDDILIRWQT